MRRGIYDLRLAIYALAVICVGGVAQAENATATIDLPTVLRLAGAQNLDVQIARERLTEAQAAEESARQNFYPWLAPGVGYRRHEGQIQDVAGNMFRVDKQSYNVGGTINAQWDLGDAIFRSLAAKQLTKAATEALASQQLHTVAEAAQSYFELAKADALIRTTEEAVRVSENYEKQLGSAVEAGLAFAGDKLRVTVQTERFRFLLEQAQTQRRMASTRLAEVLRLKMSEELTPEQRELVPLTLVDTNAALGDLVRQAFSNRPELKQSRALIAAAEETKNGAVRGVWIPTVGAQAFAGGLGGGKNESTGNFSDTADFSASVSWRVGPGGIFDSARVDAVKSRLRSAELTSEKVQQDIERQVVDAAVQVQSLQRQVESARRVLQAATANLKINEQRREFAVGVVLEVVQGQQDLARARADYFASVADFNKAQYALSYATGQLK
jgi:outer membrane protein TolC